MPALKVKAKALVPSSPRPRSRRDVLNVRPRARRPTRRFPYNLGRIYYQQGRHTEAADAFRRATALDPRAYRAVGQPRSGIGGPRRRRPGAAALPQGHRARPQGPSPLRRRLRELRGSADQARELSARLRSGSRSGAAQSRRAAQLLSRREGARSARAKRPQRALVRAGHRAERRLSRAALSARAGLPQARRNRRRRPGAEVLPGGCGARAEGAPVRMSRLLLSMAILLACGIDILPTPSTRR